MRSKCLLRSKWRLFPDDDMKPTVILSTYNDTHGLRNSLLGFVTQTYKDFEIIVADDGSTPETRQLLDSPEFATLNLQHLWQQDDGFRKTLLLNRAIANASGDYIIFVDGDCIPRDDFVATHVRLAKPGWYISGWVIDLPATIHQQFDTEDILSGRVFDVDYLKSHDEALQKYSYRLSRSRAVLTAGDLLTTRWFVFHGGNGSVWRKDLLKINGFDESFVYGSEDRDLGARLTGIGVKSYYAKFSLVMIHMGHARSWIDPEAMKRNREVFRQRLWRRDPTTFVQPGIDTAMDRKDQWHIEPVTRQTGSSRKAA